jgi:hypothetical protein
MQFFNETGKPLAGGKVYTYEAGTTTPLATFKDSLGIEANTNPVILDSRGQAAIWLNYDVYNILVYDADDVLQTSDDNVTAFVAERTYIMAGETFDANKGTIFVANLVSNREFVDGMTDGQSLTLMLTNAVTYTATWPAMVWVSDVGNSAPVLTGADVIVLWKVGSVLYGRYIGNHI